MLALTLLLVSPALAFPAPATDSTLPAPQRIEYQIHETRDDEDSPVEWSFTADLTAVGRDGDTVMWNIVAIEFHEAATQRTWRRAGDPKIANWSIKHANPMQPVDSEFAALPVISGTAAPDEATVPPLVFELSGREPSLFMVPRFWWDFSYEEEVEPRSHGENEPIWNRLGSLPMAR